MPGGSERAFFLKVMLAAYATWLAAYELVGLAASRLPTVDLTSALDRAIPLVPAFVWPYEACYLVPFVVPFVLRDWHRFNVGLLALLLANLTAFVVYFALPIAFPHPPLGASLAERVLALEYAADFSPGANAFPSMHVAITWILVAAALGQRTRLVDGLLLALALAITASTVFVKMHLVIDAVGGLAWGLGAWVIAGRAYARLVDAGTSPREALLQLVRPSRWRRLPAVAQRQ